MWKQRIRYYLEILHSTPSSLPLAEPYLSVVVRAIEDSALDRPPFSCNAFLARTIMELVFATPNLGPCRVGGAELLGLLSFNEDVVLVVLLLLLSFNEDMVLVGLTLSSTQFWEPSVGISSSSKANLFDTGVIDPPVLDNKCLEPVLELSSFSFRPLPNRELLPAELTRRRDIFYVKFVE
jgi:hypothetical protein